MYTAWAWLFWSVQPARASRERPFRNLRRSMTMLLVERADLFFILEKFFYKKRQNNNDVVGGDHYPRQVPHQVTGEPQRKSRRACNKHERRAAHRTRGADEGLQGDRDEGQREGQDESEEHLPRGGDLAEPA